MTDDNISMTEPQLPSGQAGIQKGEMRPSRLFQRQLLRLGMAFAVLLVCFSLPLLHLASFALRSDLFSYIPLVPVISAGLIWIDRKRLRYQSASSWAAAAALFIAGAALLWAAWHSGAKTPLQDSLAGFASAELCLFWGLCLGFLGWGMLRQVAFPLGFLAFMVPLPSAALAAIDSFFQYTSAWTAGGLCALAGTPVLREGLTLRLPANRSPSLPNAAASFDHGPGS